MPLLCPGPSSLAMTAQCPQHAKLCTKLCPVPTGQKRAVSLASLGCVCRPGIARELEHTEHFEEGTDKGRSFFTDIIPKDTRCPDLELEATLAKDVMDFHSLHPSGLSLPTYLPTHTHTRTHPKHSLGSSVVLHGLPTHFS